MKSWGQWVAIGVSIALSSAVYTMMIMSMSGIEGPTKAFLKETHQEDFTVEMLNRITPQEAQNPALASFIANNLFTLSEIKRVEPQLYQSLIKVRQDAFTALYPMTQLELRQTKLLYFELNGVKHKALLLKENTAINLTYLEAGALPTQDDQIAINREYAKKNKLVIGDTLTLQDQTFTICGFVLFADYTFPMFDETFNVNIALQTTVLTTPAQYERMSGKESDHFSGLFGESQDDADFKHEVLDQYKKEPALNFITKISTTDLSMRSGAIKDELVQGWVMAVGFGVFLSLISVMIVGIIIFNMLHQQRSQIGVLKALGYKRLWIAMPYVSAVLVLALIMLVFGYVIGFVSAAPMTQLYLDFYLVPKEAIHPRWDIFAVAILVPLFVFASFTFLIVVRMLRTPVLDLLHPKENQSINALTKAVSTLMSKASAQKKFTWLYALHNARSFVIFFIGILFATLLINFSFTMDGMVEKLTVANIESMPYDYESYVDFTQGIPSVTADQEKFLLYPYGRVDQLNVIVIGLEPDSVLYPLIDDHGKTITGSLTNGIIISQKLRMKKGLKIGESLTFEIGSVSHSAIIQGISDEYVEDKIYLKRSVLSLWLSTNASEDLFTGIYSIEKPQAQGYTLILAKADLLNQTKAMSGFIDTVSLALVGGSALVAFCILYVLTSQTVFQNTYAISLLKVLGYKKKEVNAMILNGYLIYALASYLVSVPITYFALKSLLALFVVQYGITLPMQFGASEAAYGLIFVIGLFYAGTLHSRHKIEAISLQEALKAYRE